MGRQCGLGVPPVVAPAVGSADSHATGEPEGLVVGGWWLVGTWLVVSG
ncbi:MAG: hypothetical protein KME31_28230 [Tolypothrix carrinoi HA7290-LM1]|nr:hypothetical protein [Tolypothrix carrinoi HA7290-LM1]